VVAQTVIANNALVELGVIASDEIPSPADQALAETKVAQVQSSLIGQAIVPWAGTAIPQAVAEEYVRLTALSLASSFGKSADPQMLPALEQRVRRISMILEAPARAQQAVQDVHDILTARGLTRWSVFDVPPAAGLPYELLAANRLAPLYDKDVAPDAEQLATRTLAQIIALPSSGERIRAEYF
jgi:hypothetical protein